MKAMTANPKRLIVGISGASGVIYGVRMLQALQQLDMGSSQSLFRIVR